MNDRLQQLALFVRTVESGSFSKAAREFGLSQPSVSRADCGARAPPRGQASRPHHPAGLGHRRRRGVARSRARRPARDRRGGERGARRRSSLGRASRRLAARIWRPPHRAVASGVLRSASAAQDRSDDVGSIREFDRRRGRSCAADRRPSGFELRRPKARERKAPLHRLAILSSRPRRARKPRRSCWPRRHQRPGGRRRRDLDRAPQRTDRTPDVKPPRPFALGDRRRRLRSRGAGNRDRVELDVCGRARFRRGGRDPHRLCARPGQGLCRLSRRPQAVAKSARLQRLSGAGSRRSGKSGVAPSNRRPNRSARLIRCGRRRRSR